MENNKIPTTEDFFEKNYIVTTDDERSFKCIDEESFKESMLEFAKLHVQEALKAASENVDADFEPMGWLAELHFDNPFIAGKDYEIGISRKSILDVYPLDKIK